MLGQDAQSSKNEPETDALVPNMHWRRDARFRVAAESGGLPAANGWRSKRLAASK
jgi:hypothetical protein